MNEDFAEVSTPRVWAGPRLQTPTLESQAPRPDGTLVEGLLGGRRVPSWAEGAL